MFSKVDLNLRVTQSIDFSKAFLAKLFKIDLLYNHSQLNLFLNSFPFETMFN